jgi:hypothetical protein
MKTYYFYFKDDDFNIVYNVILKSKKEVKKYAKRVFGNIENLVID